MPYKMMRTKQEHKQGKKVSPSAVMEASHSNPEGTKECPL
jgi:hypothetical protein